MKWNYQDNVEYAADNLVRKDLLKDPDHELYPRELLLDAIRHLRKQLDELRSENQQLIDTAEEYRLEVRRLRNR